MNGTRPDYGSYRAAGTLRDRREVVLRAVRPDDKQALVDGFGRLSEQSVYRRFFSQKRRLSDTELAYLTELDFETHVALLAVVREDGVDLPVGVGRFIRDPDRPSAEIAFTVDDRHQGLGIATLLLEHLADIARQLGVRELTAEVLSDNEDMLDVFRHSGLTMDTCASQGTSRVRLMLVPQPDTTGPQPPDPGRG